MAVREGDASSKGASMISFKSSMISGQVYMSGFSANGQVHQATKASMVNPIQRRMPCMPCNHPGLGQLSQKNHCTR